MLRSPQSCIKKDCNHRARRDNLNPCFLIITIVPIVIGALGTVTKGLLKGLEDLEVGGRVETIQTTALLKTARILRRVLETCCHSNSSEKPSANTDVKTSKGVNNNNTNTTTTNNNNNYRLGKG